MKTRRSFLGELLTAGAATGLTAALALGQNPTPAPPGLSGAAPNPPDSKLPSPDKAIMEANEKDHS